MKTLLISHSDEPLSCEALPKWLATFSDLVGRVVIEEEKDTKLKRIQRERRRLGIIRLLDVFAFRIYYTLFLKKTDALWEKMKLEELNSTYPDIDPHPELVTANPNAREVEEFIQKASPDIVIARCKTLLRKVFSPSLKKEPL